MVKFVYDGVVVVIMVLFDQDEFGFVLLVLGNGVLVNCGGEGSFDFVILIVDGFVVVLFGDQVIVVVSYIVMDDQDIVVWFQLNEVLFMVFFQVVMDVSFGVGIIDVIVDIFMNVFVGIFNYCYFVFIVLDGQGVDNSFLDFIQFQVIVLGENS